MEINGLEFGIPGRVYGYDRHYDTDYNRYRVCMSLDDEIFDKHKGRLTILSLSIMSHEHQVLPSDYKRYMDQYKNSSIVGYIGLMQDYLNKWQLNLFTYFKENVSEERIYALIEYFSKLGLTSVVNQYVKGGDGILSDKDDANARNLIKSYIASDCISSEITRDYLTYTNNQIPNLILSYIKP